MINLLKHKPFLELLAACEPGQRKALLETASPQHVHCLCLCAENIINRNYIVSKEGMNNLRPYEHEIHSLADREKSANTELFNMVMVSVLARAILSPILEGLAELV